LLHTDIDEYWFLLHLFLMEVHGVSMIPKGDCPT
jgi:hypothetical protein